MAEKVAMPAASDRASTMIDRAKRFLSGADLPVGVRDEIVAELYPKSFRIGTSILTSTVNGCVLATIMHSWLPLAWMAVALAICGVRTLDWFRYRRAPARHPATVWAARFVFGFLPFGIWWGSTAALLLISDDPLLMAVAVLSTDAQGAGAVCSYPGHPPAALSFVIPAMGMFAIAGLIRGGVFGYSVTFVEIVLMANYLIIIREFYRSILQGLIAQFEKVEIANRLVEAHQALQRESGALAEAHLALQREGAAKSEFLAHMSHELRTPLNAIIGFSDVILTETFGPLGNPRYSEYQKDINGAASHLLNIVNEVLDIARIEAGELTLQIDKVYAADLVRFTAKLIQQRARIKSLTLDVSTDPALEDAVMQTDEVRLKQALINILTNAVKFTNIGGAISFSATPAENGVSFEIRDNGVGMAEEDLKRALKPFVQVGSPMHAREGSGLGLPLSRQLVERLGGKFTIVSSLGIGTTVTIVIPLAAPAL
jgi:signal transduction histidine kinase